VLYLPEFPLKRFSTNTDQFPRLLLNNCLSDSTGLQGTGRDLRIIMTYTETIRALRQYPDLAKRGRRFLCLAARYLIGAETEDTLYSLLWEHEVASGCGLLRPLLSPDEFRIITSIYVGPSGLAIKNRR
jgi:hypothetical protein